MRTTCGSTKEADTDTAAQPLLLRKVPIPDDNSCLFHALAYLGATQEQQAVGKREEARALRRVCSDAALQHPELFLPSSEGSNDGEGAKGGDELSLAMQLGMEPEIYATKIMGPAWGGTNEILVLAKRYDIEVALVKHGLSTPLVYNKRRRKRNETASSLSSSSSSSSVVRAGSVASSSSSSSTSTYSSSSCGWRGYILLTGKKTGKHFNPLVPSSGLHRLLPLPPDGALEDNYWADIDKAAFDIVAAAHREAEEQRRAQMEEVERGLKRGRMRAKNRANTAAAAAVSGGGSASKKCSVCKRRWTIGSEVTCSDCSKF